MLTEVQVRQATIGNLIMQEITSRQAISKVVIETLIFLISTLSIILGSVSPLFTQIAYARHLPENSYQFSQLAQSTICQTVPVVHNTSSTNQLTNRRWKLQKICYSSDETITVNQPERYTLKFISDSNVQIRADCNRARGTYILNDSQLTIQVGPMTRVSCPPDSIADQYLRDLEATTTYSLQGRQLYIYLRDNAGVMVFTSL